MSCLNYSNAVCHYAGCRYSECHSAECRYAECRGASSSYGLKWPLDLYLVFIRFQNKKVSFCLSKDSNENALG